MADRDTKKRRRRRGGLIDVANGLLMMVMIGLAIGIGLFLWGVNQFYAPGKSTEQARFLVEQRSTYRSLAARLEEQGIIDSAMIFDLARRALVRGDVLLPGEYVFPAGASTADVLRIIDEGKPVEYFVMVRPGQSSYEVAQMLNDPALNLTGDPVPVPEEGSILPVRHDFFPGDERATVLKSMQDKMDTTVDEWWEKCRPDVCGPEGVLADKHAFVTMASIVEKETGLASERPIVASLFVNRLRIGMPLQTDPTILYGLYKGVPQERLVITRSQKAQATEYNTYVIKTLPPGPIANPGVAAMEAVANPADTKYLYMMAVTPGDYNDGHYFAETLQQHNANVAKYRAQERQLAEEAAEDAANAAEAADAP